MIYAIPGATFTATAEGFPTGLAGTLGVRIRDANGTDVLARTTAGITQGTDPDFGTIIEYSVTLTAPLTVGVFEVVWDDGSGNTASENLVTTYTPTASGGPQYITSAELKATLTLQNTTFADADITAAINSACRTIDKICSRRFYLDADATSVRYYTPEKRSWIEIEDLVTLGSLATDSNGDGTFDQAWVSGTDFDLEPLNAQQDSQNMEPFTSISVRRHGNFVFPCEQKSVKLTAQFGWPTVPDAIVEGATVLSNLLLTVMRSAPLGIVPFEGGAIRVARGNPQVMMLIGPYQRHRIAVG